MFTSFEITSTFLADRQQRMLGDARRHRLARSAGHPVHIAGGRPAVRVIQLPSPPQPGPVEDRIAS